MCGRYTLTVDKKTIEKRFGGRFYIAQPAYDWTPTFNAAPSQLLPIIRTHNPERIELAKWGFVREDWKNLRMRPQNNARLEMIGEGKVAGTVRSIWSASWPQHSLPRPSSSDVSL
jgi:putative SOS response-associated peptidase YedK